MSTPSPPVITEDNYADILSRYLTASWQANPEANIKDGATLAKWVKFLKKTDDSEVKDGDIVLTRDNVLFSIFNFLDKSPKAAINISDALYIDEIRTFCIGLSSSTDEKIVEL
jgi:hypothetical protein